MGSVTQLDLIVINIQIDGFFRDILKNDSVIARILQLRAEVTA